MEYRRHSLEQKIKFLDAFEKTKSISEASLRAGVPRSASVDVTIVFARERVKTDEIFQRIQEFNCS